MCRRFISIFFVKLVSHGCSWSLWRNYNVALTKLYNLRGQILSYDTVYCSEKVTPSLFSSSLLEKSTTLNKNLKPTADEMHNLHIW